MQKVLVLLPMRNLSSRVRRVLGSKLDEPKAWTKLPLPGAQMPTTAPGTGVLPPKAASSLFTAAEMAAWVAALSDAAGRGFACGFRGCAVERSAKNPVAVMSRAKNPASA